MRTGGPERTVSENRTVAVSRRATTDIGPARVPAPQRTHARPMRFGIAVSVSLPPGLSPVQVTVPLSDALPYASVTSTTSRTGNTCSGSTDWPLPSKIRSVAGGPTSAVAWTTTVAESPRTVSHCSPAVGPSVHSAVALPALSVFAAVTVPADALHSSAAPAIGPPCASVACTTMLSSRVMTGAD